MWRLGLTFPAFVGSSFLQVREAAILLLQYHVLLYTITRKALLVRGSASGVVQSRSHASCTAEPMAVCIFTLGFLPSVWFMSRKTVAEGRRTL